MVGSQRPGSSEPGRMTLSAEVMAKLIVSTPTVLLARLRASRREPLPESLMLVTGKTARRRRDSRGSTGRRAAVRARVFDDCFIIDLPSGRGSIVGWRQLL